MRKILNYLNNPNNKTSIELLKKIQSNIEERSFHLSGHIIYDIIDLIEKEEIVYTEIGTYCGASVSLAISNKKTKEAYCIDPLTLPKSHYGGTLNQEETIIKNIAKIESDVVVEVFKNFSSDTTPINFFVNKEIDLLYIDGDHTFEGALADWKHYSGFVAKGGFVIFDDYYDFKYSPGVKRAVDYIIRNKLNKDFVPIGCPDNVHNIKFSRTNNIDKNNSFIFARK